MATAKKIEGMVEQIQANFSRVQQLSWNSQTQPGIRDALKEMLVETKARRDAQQEAVSLSLKQLLNETLLPQQYIIAIQVMTSEQTLLNELDKIVRGMEGMPGGYSVAIYPIHLVLLAAGGKLSSKVLGTLGYLAT